MKRLLIAVPFLLCAAAIAQEIATIPGGVQTAPAKLTNKEILDMHQAGLSTEIIVEKMQTSVCDYNTSPAALAELKNAGVADSLVLAMLRCQSSPLQQQLSRKQERGKTGSAAQITAPVTTGTSAAGEAKVRVYAIPWRGGLQLYCDRVLLAKVHRGRYMAADIAPGRHLFHNLYDSRHGIEMDFQSGREYYVTCHPQQTVKSAFMVGRLEFPCTVIDPEEGKSEIQKLKPMDVKDIRDARVVRSNGRDHL